MYTQLSLIYGKLTVTRAFPHPDSGRQMCQCVCQCGKTTTVRRYDLEHGKTKSCGCEMGHPTHRSRGTPTWWTWIAMRRRCNDPEHQDFKNYGGRGIKVCAEWDDPETGFVAFRRDMGERPAERTLDRIEVNGGYEKSNCRWATKLEQEFNKRRWTRVNARRAALRLERQREMAGWDAMEQEYLREHPETT